MDGRGYLKSYGWQEGEGLRVGALKKPILVKHKRDRKGLGGAIGDNDGEAWWETLFDGQLKNLDVKVDKDSGVSFHGADVSTASKFATKQTSPLYQWFVKGGCLKGTLEANTTTESIKNGSEDENETASTKRVKSKSGNIKKVLKTRSKLNSDCEDVGIEFTNGSKKSRDKTEKKIIKTKTSKSKRSKHKSIVNSNGKQKKNKDKKKRKGHESQ